MAHKLMQPTSRRECFDIVVYVLLQLSAGLAVLCSFTLVEVFLRCMFFMHYVGTCTQEM